MTRISRKVDTHEAAPIPLRPHEIRRVCVIGGAGFVGSVLVERLLDEGHDVTVLDSCMYGDESIQHLVDRPGCTILRGDLRDTVAIVTACRDTDAVVHLGALVGDPACELDEDLTLEINRDATYTAAALARALGVERFVFASTCSVYGATDEQLHEDSLLAPISLYARSKAESEQLLLPLAGNGFCPTVLRFGTLYGQSHRERFDLVVNLLAAKAVVDGEITITGGEQWRPFVHVADCAEAILQCLHAPRSVVSGRIYNVGSDEQNHTLRDIATIVNDVVPGVRVRFEPAAAQEANYHVSFARIREELGFSPARTVADGIGEIKAAVERGRVSNYTDARYSNYKALASGDVALARNGARAAKAAG